MALGERELREKLKAYSQNDIYFLKAKWRRWIENKEFEKFTNVDGKPNVQEVYKILNPDEILYVKPARQDFYEARIKHSNKFDITIIFKINEGADRIEIITYYKESVKHRQPPRSGTPQ